MKCLIVDDNKMARMALKQLVGQVPSLELVAECNDATEALNFLNNTQIDLLLLDIEMPRMDGFQFAEKVRNQAKYKGIPIIMITFSAGEEERSHARKLGIEKFISKPYQEAELLETLDLLLEKRQ